MRPILVLCFRRFLVPTIAVLAYPCWLLAAADYRPGSGQLTAAQEDETWTDQERNREIPVRIYAPDPKHGRGPFPVVVFSHGGGESNAAFGYLGRPWAENGYIVVFITHRGSDAEALKDGGMAALGTGDFSDRPADMSFVVDRLCRPDLTSRLLKGRMDTGRIAAAGQCAGSSTALAMVGLTAETADGQKRSFADKRFKVAVALSPQIPFRATRRGDRLHDGSWSSVQGPVLVVTGTKDFSWVAAGRSDPRMVNMPFERMPAGDKYLVEIANAEHNAFTDSKPYYPAGERDPRHHGWIAQATTAFLDAFLKGDKPALDWLQTAKLQAATGGLCRHENKTAAGSARDFSAVDRLMEESLPRMGGGVCLILIQGTEVVYRKAFGSFKPETVVPIASASKWISAGVIMALVDEGKLSLDDNASKYLPEFKGKKGGITIRQMFSYTHGFPEAPHHHRNTRLTMEEAVAKIAAVDLAFDPGTAIYYSGLGMQVAGRIAEIVTDKPWVEVFQQKIGGPCAMKNTSYYAFGQTKNPNVAGSVQTCVDDYGNYVSMLLNKGMFKGKRVLSEVAVGEILRNQTGDLPVRRHPWEKYGDFAPEMEESRAGLGCWLEAMDPRTGNALRASCGGAFGCQPFVDPAQNMAGVFLPFSRQMRESSEGEDYNGASVVYVELKNLLAGRSSGAPAPKPAAAARPAPAVRADGASPEQRAAFMVRRSDRDGDGQLSREEMPERLARGFDALDTDRNGKVSREELAAGLRRLDSRPQQPGATDSQPAKPAERPAPTSPRPQESLYKTKDKPPGKVATVESLTLRDKQRNKDLQIRLTYPEGDGKCPVVVYSHYAGGSKDEYVPLMTHWASHGYICIQPNHSDSPAAGGTRGLAALQDWPSRPLDAAFVLDSLVEIERQVPALLGRTDADRIGIGGHYVGSLAAGFLGGMKRPDTQGKTFEPADKRVKAALMMSPVGRGQGFTEESWAGLRVPTMFLTGSADASRRTGNPPEWRTEPFQFAPPGDKYLVWIEGLGASGGGIRAAEREEATWPDAHSDYIKAATLCFWDAHLKKDGDAFAYLNAGGLERGSNGEIKVTTKHKPSAQARAISEDSFKKAADYSARNGGRAALVMVDGRIMFERYDNGHSADTATHLHSGTKGFWGPVVAAMIEDGLARSFDEAACDTLAEWREDPVKRTIKLRQLLELNAGLAQDITALQGHDRPTLAPDLYAHAVSLHTVTKPGQFFVYGPSCYYALGEVLKRKLAPEKQSPLDYLQTRILKPIGATASAWVHDKSGNPHIPNGASLTARNWARYGQFLLQDGWWEGKQLVRKELMQEVRKPGAVNPGHGLALWLNQPGGYGSTRFTRLQNDDVNATAGFIYPDGFPDLVGALGAGKCRMYVIPSLKTVIVRQADTEVDRYVDATFLRLLFQGEERSEADPVVPAADDKTYSSDDGRHRIASVENLVLKDAKRNKDLQLRINYPDAAGRFPIIVFCHGAWGTKDAYQPLTRFWASHGYVTIQANHSDSRDLGGKPGLGAFRDWENRPADVSFILDSLAQIEAIVPGLKGRLDGERIGVGGHSFGANTAQLIGGATAQVMGESKRFADERVRAVLLLSAQGRGGQFTEESWQKMTRPTLTMTGSRDPGRNGEKPEWRKEPYEFSPPGEKYLIWVEGLDHSFGGIVGEDFKPADTRIRAYANNDAHVALTKVSTLAFWDAYLKDSAHARAYLKAEQGLRKFAGPSTTLSTK